MTTVSFRLDDEEILARLDDEDNQSAVFREALRQYYATENDYGLPDRFAEVYRDLLDLTGGGGRINIEIAKRAIPQGRNHYEKHTIVDGAFRPLGERGYLSPIGGVDTVWLDVYPPEQVEAALERETSTAASPVSTTEDEHAEAILNGDYQIGEEVGSA